MENDVKGEQKGRVHIMIEKGSFGYINKKKKRKIIMVVVIILIALAIFAVGLLLNKMSRANIFTVLAILCVLPWAKQLVALIVLFPYHSVSSERYERALKSIEVNGMQDLKLYTDLVITSPDKVMNLDFAVVGAGHVIALVGKSGQDVSYIREYLTNGVHQWGDFQVQIVTSEKLFLKEVERMQLRLVSEEDAERVDSYLRSLIV